MINHLIDDKFYDDKPFLTAKKAINSSGKHDVTIEYIRKNNIKTCVLTFYAELKAWLDTLGKVDEIGFIQAGEDHHPMYVVDGILFVVPFVGAPNAAATMEELGAMGIKNFIACGSAGLIDHTFDGSKMLVVTDAIRDEGTSYHYASANVLATTDNFVTKNIEQALKNHKVKFEVGRTWTTDAFYRETEKLIALRINQGCTAVEMECATWCVVAKKMGFKFGQFLYFSDAVNSMKDWGMFPKEYRHNLKVVMTDIAYEVAKAVDKK